MSNFNSRITIEPQEAMQKIRDIIHNFEHYDKDKHTFLAVNNFFTKDEILTNKSHIPYSNGDLLNPLFKDEVDQLWLFDNIGCKKLDIELDFDIFIRSVNNVPEGLIIKFYELCISEFENVEIKCKCWNDSDNDFGFIFIKDGYYLEFESTVEDEIYEDALEDEEYVNDWIKNNFYDDSVDFNNPESINETQFEEIFDSLKNEIKWKYINNRWDSMLDESLKSIAEVYFDRSELKMVKKIAQKKLYMIKNCYPL